MSVDNIVINIKVITQIKQVLQKIMFYEFIEQ